jgi:hypothetical protein
MAGFYRRWMAKSRRNDSARKASFTCRISAPRQLDKPLKSKPGLARLSPNPYFTRVIYPNSPSSGVFGAGIEATGLFIAFPATSNRPARRSHPFVSACRRRHVAARPSARRRTSRSVLVVIVVAVGLIGRIMRLVALIVPEPSIHAVGGEQLGMRTTFDRLAA